MQQGIHNIARSLYFRTAAVTFSLFFHNNLLNITAFNNITWNWKQWLQFIGAEGNVTFPHRTFPHQEFPYHAFPHWEFLNMSLSFLHQAFHIMLKVNLRQTLPNMQPTIYYSCPAVVEVKGCRDYPSHSGKHILRDTSAQWSTMSPHPTTLPP